MLVETAKMAELKNFGKPDEVREFPKGRLELIKVGGATIGRGVFEPGWRWATSVQPIAKTKSCEAPHFQYHVAGVLRVKMDDVLCEEAAGWFGQQISEHRRWPVSLLN
jgi:hypothetical protein